MRAKSTIGMLVSGILGLAAAVLLLATACAERRDWTRPWTRTESALYGRIAPELFAPPDPSLPDLRGQAKEVAEQRSTGCLSCHAGSSDPHKDELAVHLACVDCHGGDGLATALEDAHPRPRHPELWESAANPERSYNELLDEDPAWIRFVNPGDLRVADHTCGACHDEEVHRVHKSIMTNASHFWGVASYANGIVSNKSTIFGESYSPEGIAQAVFTVPRPSAAEKARGVTELIVPLPHFEVGQTGNVFRVFETGSRLGGAALGFNGAPVPLIGLPEKLDDPGRPNNRLSDRGLGTLNRVDLPLLNIFKTRLNDPLLSFLGTNDNPGDYRSSGCTACHMVYANDRSPVSSGPWAKYGNRGMGNASVDPGGAPVAADPQIRSDESGHPVMHRFTTAIPSSQCMTCHHHQPNSFVNSYLGFTMWAYDTDGERMWPEEEVDTSAEERWEIMLRNPEEAAQRGNWGFPNFLAEVSALNSRLSHTQFADYHGHGWVFRGAFKMDRAGQLLDAQGGVVRYDDPAKFQGVLPELGSSSRPPFTAPAGKPVHLMDIHAEKGMHCVDCHFEDDVHGDGKLYAEYQAAVEITCQDCHGSLTSGLEGERFLTSGPASGAARNRDGSLEGADSPARTDLFDDRYETSFGEKRFDQRADGTPVQRSMLYPELEWAIPQVGSTVSERAARAHGVLAADGTLAHGDGKMECYACHSSWITSCFGCHLPQQANWKTPVRHYEGEELRNFATYNPQVARDAEFMLGIAGNVKKNRIAPVRSSSAIVISSQDAQRQKIYGGVPTIAANGMSSQTFNTHFPHTVRTTETRACSDCHLSSAGDNNAWMAQVLLLGTNQVNFMGHNAFVGLGEGGFAAVQVTEWDEPQAVIGSHLHLLAYPERYRAHLDHGRELQNAIVHDARDVRSLQLRGEYLYTANGEGGFRVFDVANVNHKGFSQRVVTAPVSPLGQDTHVSTAFATAVALPTNNHVSMSRKFRPENQETPYTYAGRVQNMHELYRYAYVSDREEGLVVIDVDCLTDFDPKNNFIEKVLSFNPDGVLDGAENLTLAGTTAYMCCKRGVVAVDLSDPRAPRVLAEIGAPEISAPTSISVQFRYAFVTDAVGLKVLDVTFPERMRAVPGAQVPIAGARDVAVAKTYAYVSAGAQGLVIVDVTRPEAPVLRQVFDADGRIDDLFQTKIASTNDSVFAYLADGENGLHVLKLITPNDGGRSAYGFSPEPRPEWIATYPTGGRARAVSEGLDRDRAVDESGNQMAVFGRIGGRPMNKEEMGRLYIKDGEPWFVEDEPGQEASGAEAQGSGAR